MRTGLVSSRNSYLNASSVDFDQKHSSASHLSLYSASQDPFFGTLGINGYLILEIFNRIICFLYLLCIYIVWLHF